MHNIAKGNIECSLVSATFPGKPFRSLPKASSIAQRIQEEQGIPLKEKRTSNSGMGTSHARWLWGLRGGWLQWHWGYPAALSSGHNTGAEGTVSRARDLEHCCDNCSKQKASTKAGNSVPAAALHPSARRWWEEAQHQTCTPEWPGCSAAPSAPGALRYQRCWGALGQNQRAKPTPRISTIKQTTYWKFPIYLKFKINAKLWCH